MKLEEKKPSVFCFPQGIGDFLHVLDRFLIGHLEKNYNPNDIFIFQYVQQKEILNFLLKKKFNIFLTKELKRNPFVFIKLIHKLLVNKYEYLVIEPNISITKTHYLSSIIRFQKRFSALDSHFKFKNYNKALNYDIIYKHIHLSENTKKLFDYFKNYKKSKKNIKVGISAGSGSLEKHKRWPKSYFSDLINLILKKNNNGVEICLFGSSQEYELNKYIYNNIDNKFKPRVSIFKDFSIINTFKEFINLDLFLANDNGLSHAAFLLNVKTLSIYGPTDENDHGVFSNRYIIRENMNCAPCYKKLRFGCGNEVCLKSLNPDKVYNKLLSITNL